MPSYVYRCDQNHEFEIKQKMTDDPLETCPQCQSSCHRIIQSTGVVYKGAGFYKNDARMGRNGANNEPPRKRS